MSVLMQGTDTQEGNFAMTPAQGKKLTTRTGAFPVGYRRVGFEWLNTIESMISYAEEAGFGGIDLPADAVERVSDVHEAGLQVGTVDLNDWQDLITADEKKRVAAIDANERLMRQAMDAGANVFFLVALPADPSKPRRENLALAIEGLGGLADRVKDTPAKIVLEGWPGPGALGCTPETCRALIHETPGQVVGVNYDPSHLLRMRIDPVRFLREFAPHIYHVHGKDVEIDPDAVYEFGVEQPAARAEAPAFGGFAWRYCIPGHGVTPWALVMRVLADSGYDGMISIELEDRHFNGAEAGERLGLETSLALLAGT